MKKTQKNNGKKCSEEEYLDIQVFDHFKKTYTYIIWNDKYILGEVVEDNIVQLLNKKQLIDFYHAGKNNFKVQKWKIEAYLSKDDK
jgi:hypothetical protein